MSVIYYLINCWNNKSLVVRTIAIASDFRVAGAKLPEILQKEGALGSEIAARNRKSPATLHRTLKSQCSIAFSRLGNRCDFWGPQWALQLQKIAKIAAISARSIAMSKLTPWIFAYRVHTKGVMQHHATLRRVLRRFSNSKCFLEGFLEGACKGFQ